MSYLFKWQSISFISRVTAMLLGIVQSVYIVNTLSQADWGAIQVIAGIASLVGTSQAFGLTSGSTREISGAKTNQEAFKVFLTSIGLRLAISLPFAVYLYFFADSLAGKSQNPQQVAWALKVIAFVLIFQAAQGIFNSVLSGFRKFKVLFTYQVLIAVISVSLYIPLVYLFKFHGFYYAYLAFNVIGAIVLFFLAMRNFERPLPGITKKELKIIFKEIFGISLVVYLVKLLHTLWLQSPVLYLNYILDTPEAVISLFGFALLYSTKLMIFSDSITDVTLPVMSKKFVENIDEFKEVYKKNYTKTFILITAAAAVAAFWNRELITLVIKQSYFESTFLIPLTLLGVWSYSNINLLKSSVFVPAKKLVGLFVTYVFMIIFVYSSFLILRLFWYTDVLMQLSTAFGIGTFLAFLMGVILIKKSFNLSFFDKFESSYFLISVFYLFFYYLNIGIFGKILLTLIYGLISIYYLNRLGMVSTILNRLRGLKSNL